MSVLDRLAGALDRRDEEPNIELARDLARSGNKEDVAILADALETAPRPVRSNAIKALYELGALRPELIRPHADAFLAAMDSRDNRLAWGALTALDALAESEPALIAANLPGILAAADRGSVIAKDKAVSILATLASREPPVSGAWDHLLDTLRTSALNQTPMYAEAALRAAPANDPAALAAVVRKRLETTHLPAKRARLEKVLKQLAKMKG
jgi:hypothetical protein